MPRTIKLLFTLVLVFAVLSGKAGDKNQLFKVIAFYTAKSDQSHISFVHEANQWFSKVMSVIILATNRPTTRTS